MEKISKQDLVAAFILSLPLTATIAFAFYRLALEVWCFVYGLIY